MKELRCKALQADPVVKKRKFQYKTILIAVPALKGWQLNKNWSMGVNVPDAILDDSGTIGVTIRKEL